MAWFFCQDLMRFAAVIIRQVSYLCTWYYIIIRLYIHIQNIFILQYFPYSDNTYYFLIILWVLSSSNKIVFKYFQKRYILKNNSKTVCYIQYITLKKYLSNSLFPCFKNLLEAQVK